MGNVKIISWNVNGLRAVAKKGLVEWMVKESPDIFMIQEVKATEDKIPMDLKFINGYKFYLNSAQKAGYAGTAIYSKTEPLSVSLGMGIEEHDKEGRVLTLEFEKFYAVCVYVPNSKPDLSRLNYRQVWDRDFLNFLKKLEEKKPVVFGGDLNVAHEEIDLARPKENVGEHGFTNEERQGFSNFLKAGFVDIFREFHKEPDHYTWWSYFGGARARNVGWRIDYILVSESLKNSVERAFILPDVMGSDHCPVGIEIQI